uniref:Uncharacterized protein n=1 Tax=Arundo donax TaxID=35708 RepID=A0A0A9F5A3_ARUDO
MTPTSTASGAAANCSSGPCSRGGGREESDNSCASSAIARALLHQTQIRTKSRGWKCERESVNGK